MHIRNVRNTCIAGKVVRKRFNRHMSHTGTWTTSPYPNIGIYQNVLGYRGERITPEWRSQHPADMLKWEGTSILSPLQVVPVGVEFYGHEGHIAAACFNKYGPQYYTNQWAVDDFRMYTGEAILKGLASVKSPTFDGSTNLGELKETLSMIRNPLVGIRKLARELVRGYRRGRGFKLVEYLSNQWLEYRYGIMPLVGTVSDLLDTVDKKTEGGKIIYKVHAGKLYPISDNSRMVNGLADAFPIKYYAEQRIVREIRTGVVFWAYLNDTEHRRWGLRASDLPATVWELIPYSFMVDWIWNVGDYIRAITPNREIKILSSCVSCASRRITTHILDRMEYSSTSYAPAFGRSDVVESYLQRKISYTVPALPIMNKKILNWKRSLDLIGIGIVPQIKKLLNGRK